MKLFLGLILTFLVSNLYATDPYTAYEMVLDGKAVLIDVREMEELKEGMIKEAAWFPKSEMIPGSQMVEDFKDFVGDKKVFVYCEGGKRALACQEILRKEGVKAESIGGYKDLKKILPTKSIYQRVNEPLSKSD